MTFLGAMLNLRGTTGDPFALVYSVISLIGGLGFSLYEFIDSKVNIEYYLLSLSAFYLIAGVLRLYVFQRRHPVVDLPVEDL